jgi:dTDP-glucose 4,6-dehydratase
MDITPNQKGKGVGYVPKEELPKKSLKEIELIISDKNIFVNNNKSILVTGCAGFIGSNFVPYFLEKYKNYNIINLDLLTYAGNLENLKECETNERYKFIKGDICNRPLVEFIFTQYDIKGVIHFAAESHVDNSIKNPGIFIETNVNGTFTLIDVAYKYWMDKPNSYKKDYKNCIFHHISTDEVYGTLNETDLFTENTSYAPNSPYSASKASSDMIVRSYQETYGLNTVITNCSNNYGPKQHDEKLIPTIIRKALNGKSIPIYGDGKNIRDWLYVLDHCKGIDLVYHTGKEGNVYNIGGRNERTNLQIVNTICSILDKKIPTQNNSKLKIKNLTLESYKSLITFVDDRAGHDRRYAIDATKLENELGWKADENFDSGIVKTIEWYLKKYEPY